MSVNAYEELLEIKKEFDFEGIPIAEINVCYTPPKSVAETMLKELRRKDMYWDEQTLALDGSERFPDRFYSSRVVPLNHIWIDFGCGGIAFNPNLDTKTYFIDGVDVPERIEIERKIDEIMAHYNYTKLKRFSFSKFR